MQAERADSDRSVLPCVCKPLQVMRHGKCRAGVESVFDEKLAGGSVRGFPNIPDHEHAININASPQVATAHCRRILRAIRALNNRRVSGCMLDSSEGIRTIRMRSPTFSFLHSSPLILG